MFFSREYDGIMLAMQEQAGSPAFASEEEKKSLPYDAANEATIFHLIANDPEPIAPVEEETKSHTLEYKNPSLSRKQCIIESNNTKVTEEPIAPIDLINSMLEYDDFDSVIGHGAVPLVSTLFNSIKTQKDARLKELLTAIVNGEPDIVEAMLERDPSLLLEKLDEDDYVTALSGQKSNNAAAYRTALAVEDSQMAAMIKNKLFELTGNNDAANAQYREQFPDGWAADEAKRWAPVFTTLDTLTTVIRDAKPGDISSSGNPEYKLTVREGSDVAVVLAQFRAQLDALLDEVVTTGRHFNPNLLWKAFQIYHDHFRDYFGGDWKDPRAMLFWQQIIGTIQRRLPVNYVQAFCDGLYTTKEKLRNNQPQGRSLKIELGNMLQQSWVPTDFYPLSLSRLGFDYAIFADVTHGDGLPGTSCRSRAWQAFRRHFRSLCKSKTVCMQTFVPHQSQNVRSAQRFAR